MTRTVPLVLLTLLLSPLPTPAAGKVTLAGLLRQMTDLELLAEFPDPPYVTRQFSSYDRDSVGPPPASPEQEEHPWFANHDRGFTLYDGVVAERTPYFKAGPQQGRPPDGYFEAGTRVGLGPKRKPIGDYVRVYATAPDGGPINGQIPAGYVQKSSIRMDPQGHVLAEMDGPGCVVRIWSPDPADAGRLRIYLDGAREPALDAPLEALLAGKWQTETDGKKWTPFPDPIASEHSRGWNLYFPIAYARHCKITVEKSDLYYHVDYRTYPKGTEIETFNLQAVAQKQAAVAHVARVLRGEEAAFDPGIQSRSHTLEHDFDLAPGQRTVLISVDGPGKVHEFSVALLRKMIPTPKDQAAALRGLVLVGTFDGASKPHIWCPLGDFFGSAPGFNPFRSLPFKNRVYMTKSGPEGALLAFNSWWVMPFRKKAVFELYNASPVQVRGKGRLEFLQGTPRSSGLWTDRSMYFHARWRTETMKTRPFRDWTYADLKGKGVFVGDMLSVANPVEAWWGEGDEKIYVDGEKFPSWFGTGTEDYYGFGWCDPHPFQHAYHNQTRCDGPANHGYTSVNRFHILDAIPFTRSFRFDIEVWHWTPNIHVTYAATSYWYARPGASDDFPALNGSTLSTIPEVPPFRK